jgi:hypothetical protein
MTTAKHPRPVDRAVITAQSCEDVVVGNEIVRHNRASRRSTDRRSDVLRLRLLGDADLDAGLRLDGGVFGDSPFAA